MTQVLDWRPPRRYARHQASQQPTWQRRLRRHRHHLQIVGEQLAKLSTCRAGDRVLDVARATATPRWRGANALPDVTSTDYVPALLHRPHGRKRSLWSLRACHARRCPSPMAASTSCCHLRAIFTPDHPVRRMKIAASWAGGRIGLANWTMRAS